MTRRGWLGVGCIAIAEPSSCYAHRANQLRMASHVQVDTRNQNPPRKLDCCGGRPGRSAVHGTAVLEAEWAGPSVGGGGPPALGRGKWQVAAERGVPR